MTAGPSAIERRRSVAAAGHAGDDRLIREALADPDPAVRATALGALARCDALDDATLATALVDGSPTVRRRAAELAALFPSVELDGALADADPMVVEMAAWACGEREDPSEETIGRLEEIIGGHPEPLTRESAVAALGAIGADRSLPVILAALSDKPAVRRRAVIALAAYDTPEVDAAMRTALTDRDWQVRQAAEELLHITDSVPTDDLGSSAAS